MSKKFTIEETKEIFEKFGLEVLDTEAKGIDYKYTVRDKEGYLYNRSTHSAQATLKRGRKNNGHIFSTKNKFFYENMIHYIDKEVKTGTILLTKKEEIKSIKQVLTFKCGLCGREYKTNWHNFVDNKEKICNFCFNQKKSKGETTTNHVDTNKFHKVAMNEGLILLSGPDVKYHTKVVVQDSNGYKGVMMPISIERGSSFEKFSKRNPYTIDNLRIYAFNKRWDCVIYNQEYKGDKDKIKVMCSCGKDFYVDPYHFINGKYQCNECRVKQSSIAASVELWLNKNNIQYEKEFIFNECCNKKPLPFDFYLTDYKACVEVDGIGHYRPVNFSGNKLEAEDNFQKTKTNDSIKTEYCRLKNIPLLRLPFWVIEKEEHKQCLQDFILSLSNKTNELIK